MSDPISLRHFQQSAEGYCLPACGQMVLNYLGLKLSENAIAETLGTQEFGTPSFAVQHLTAFNVRVDYHEWSIPQLLIAIQSGQPVIVFVRTGFLDYWTEDLAHAVVIVGATESQNFSVHDPALATGPTTVSWNGLLAAWAEFSYRGATISKV
jgi:ABC-type bacteriocin/lantibiotic exporter with double-glycine peptidase domain